MHACVCVCGPYCVHDMCACACVGLHCMCACLESRHHIKRSDSQASYANAPHLAVGWTEDKGYNYGHSSVPYRRPCLGHTSLIIQEISSAAISPPHHERFCPTRDLYYIPTPDAFHFGSGVGPPVTLHCGKLWDTRRHHLKLGLAVGPPSMPKPIPKRRFSPSGR